MSAGLPGLGLGGLFFILSALLAPFIEIGRIALGRGRAVDWHQVWRQFALALAMIAAVDLTLRSIYAISHLLGLGDTLRLDVVTVIPLVPVAITACLLAAVLLTAKAVDLATPVLRGLPPISAALPSRTRVLALTGVVGAVWFALLFSGASDLSRLPGRDGGVESTPAGPTPADPDDAGGMVAAAASDENAAESHATVAAAEPPDDASASGAGTGAEDPTTTSGGEAREGSTAPSTAAPAPSQAPVLAEPMEPAGSPSTSNAPDPLRPPDETTTPQAPEPVAEPPSLGGGPPTDSGPPASAGPPEHSNAPPQAGPG